MRNVQLVDLECRDRRRPLQAERRDDARVHVGAVGLGGDLAEFGQGRGGHARGRRLSVCPGDQRGPFSGGETAHDVRVDLLGDQAADHRSLAAPRGARRPAGSRRSSEG